MSSLKSVLEHSGFFSKTNLKRFGHPVSENYRFLFCIIFKNVTPHLDYEQDC